MWITQTKNTSTFFFLLSVQITMALRRLKKYTTIYLFYQIEDYYLIVITEKMFVCMHSEWSIIKVCPALMDCLFSTFSKCFWFFNFPSEIVCVRPERIPFVSFYTLDINSKIRPESLIITLTNLDLKMYVYKDPAALHFYSFRSYIAFKFYILLRELTLLKKYGMMTIRLMGCFAVEKEAIENIIPVVVVCIQFSFVRIKEKQQ